MEVRENAIRLEAAIGGFRTQFEEAALAILTKVDLREVVRSLRDDLNEQAALRSGLLVEIINNQFASLRVSLMTEFAKAKAAILEEIQAKLSHVIHLITSSKEEMIANNNFNITDVVRQLKKVIMEQLKALFF